MPWEMRWLHKALSGQREIIVAKLWALNFTLLKDDAKLQTFRKGGIVPESEMSELVCGVLVFSLS